jgi:hypothetical protein
MRHDRKGNIFELIRVLLSRRHILFFFIHSFLPPSIRYGKFPRENFSFPGPFGLVTSAQRVPAQTKKKEKLGQFSAQRVPAQTKKKEKLGQFSAQREALR